MLIDYSIAINRGLGAYPHLAMHVVSPKPATPRAAVSVMVTHYFYTCVDAVL